MKVILFIIFVLTSFCTNSNERIEIYKNAVERIKESKELNKVFGKKLETELQFKVSQEVVFLEFSNFDKLLPKKQGNTKNVIAFLDSLTTLENEIRFEPFENKDLSMLSTNEKSLFTVFFSKPYKNMLVAEVLYNYNNSKSYKDMTLLNEGLMFLFYFDDENNITRELTANINYN